MSRTPVIHLINSLWNAASGSELRTVALYDELTAGGIEARLWTEHRPAVELAAHYPIRRIHPLAGIFPRGGTQVHIGAYLIPRWWVRFSHPARVILVHNTFTQARFLGCIEALSAGGRREVEIVYTSELLRQQSGLPGVVHLSPIRIDRFTARHPIGGEIFTVGRHSRDIAAKHHPADPGLYRRLARTGVKVRILGGSVLGPELKDEPGVELSPASVGGVPEFLCSLDVFFYRTSLDWLEPLGRVVFEAMAAGLPVVCERRGGYVDYIEDGVNGFLFDDDDGALAILNRLRGDVELRRRVGEAGRRSVERLLGAETLRQYAEFYSGRPVSSR